MEHPEQDPDAVDETGALDDAGATFVERPPVGDPEEYPAATEDRPDSFDYGRARDEEV